MSRYRIRTHFQYFWWVYLVIPIVAAVLWCTVFSSLAHPAPYERLNITFVGEIDETSLQEDLLQFFQENESPVREVNVEKVEGDNAMLADIVAMRCLGETDLIVFEEDYLVTPVSSNFGPLDAGRLQDYFGDIGFYEEDGETFGIVLYDGENACRFADYYSGSRQCLALVTPVSENAFGVNGKGAEENDAALRAIQYLMESE